MATDITQIQAQIRADPRVQAIVNDPTLRSRDKQTKIAQIQQQLGLPDGYYLNELGQVTKYRPWWEKYVAPAIAGTAGFAGAALTAPAAAVASSAAAPAAAAPAAASAIPTITGTAYGTGMATAIPSIPTSVSAAAAPSLIDTLNGVGKLANGVEQTRSQNRAAQADYGLVSDRNLLSAANLKLNAEGGRERQLVGADLSAGLKAPSDPRAAPFLTNTTGVSPDTIALIRKRAQDALATGSDVPAMSTMPKPGKTDSLLNALDYAGTGLSLWKTLGGLF